MIILHAYIIKYLYLYLIMYTCMHTYVYMEDDYVYMIMYTHKIIMYTHNCFTQVKINEVHWKVYVMMFLNSGPPYIRGVICIRFLQMNYMLIVHTVLDMKLLEDHIWHRNSAAHLYFSWFTLRLLSDGLLK